MNLKESVIRGGLAKVVAQVASFALRIGSLMVLARLLDPRDFGLVGMVAVFTGVLNLFRDFGLSSATVQRLNVTDDQISTLFWINVLVGVILGLLLMAMAPVVVTFYHEPRLFWVTIILATAFMFNGAGVQHTALLERQMRFTALAAIDIFGLVVSTTLGISMAKAGFGFWALVAASVSLPFVTTLCLWWTAGWIPGRPRLQIGLHSMMRFGGGFTLVNLIAYTAYNLEKVLLGRFWGADAVGIYGRAYQLVNLPTDNLNAAVWGVAFSGLSRVRTDPNRFKSYFLKGYSLVLAPLVITGYVIGLSYGPKGVAFAYSAVMTLWAVPHIAWCVHGTMISFRDIMLAASRPLGSGIVAAVIAFGVQFFWGQSLSPLLRLMLGTSVLLIAYIGVLFYVMGQKAVYWDLVRGLSKRSSAEETPLVPA